eukprot:6278787-Prymnesium_polylepis.1
MKAIQRRRFGARAVEGVVHRHDASTHVREEQPPRGGELVAVVGIEEKVLHADEQVSLSAAGLNESDNGERQRPRPGRNARRCANQVMRSMLPGVAPDDFGRLAVLQEPSELRVPSAICAAADESPPPRIERRARVAAPRGRSGPVGAVIKQRGQRPGRRVMWAVFVAEGVQAGLAGAPHLPSGSS